MLFSGCQCCVGDRIVARQVRARDAKRPRDPTGTGKIRRAYEREILRRFREIRRVVRQAIVQLDVLGLRKGQPDPAQTALSMLLGLQMSGAAGAGSRPGFAFSRDAVAPAANAFAFNSSSGKVSSFMEWLYQQERADIIGIQAGTPIASASQQSWQNLYLETSYRKAMRQAYGKIGIEASGQFISAAFSRPVHADRVGIIFTRAYRELEGITDEMDRRMSRVLASGMANGLGPMEIARQLEDEIDVGITRARTMARTEVINAHAEATLNSFEEAGVQGVEVLAEFSTSDDDAVCPECEELEGKEMTIDEARGLIPVHPNCRCAYLPVVAN